MKTYYNNALGERTRKEMGFVDNNKKKNLEYRQPDPLTQF